MALTRVTTWTAGQVLTAAALNAEFNNILNNPISLFSPTTGNINMNGNQLTNLVLEKLGADPAAATAGRIYYNTATTLVKLDTGATIVTVGPSTAAGGSGTAPVGSRVLGLSGILSTNLAQFAARQYLLQTTNPLTNSFICTATSQLTVNSRSTWTAGTNGRDSVAALATPEAHWYVISTGANSTAPQGIVSTAPPPTGPTMPTSYSAWAYLFSAVYSTFTSGLSTGVAGLSGPTPILRAKGCWMYSDNAISIVSSGTSTGQILSSEITEVVPTDASDQYLVTMDNAGGSVDGTGSISITHGLQVTPGSTFASRLTRAKGTVGDTLFQSGGQFILPVVSSSSPLTYTQTVTVGSAPTLDLYINGYRVANGDA